MITSILNEGTKKISNLKDKDFKSVIHKDKDGNDIVSELKYLKSSLRLGVLTQYKWNLASLKAAKNKGRKVGRIKFESEHKTVIFLQHGITHQISGPNSYHIQGFVGYTVAYGAYYDDTLVGVMTFLNEGKTWNLNRFSTNTNYSCPGVASKLFNAFIKEYNLMLLYRNKALKAF